MRESNVNKKPDSSRKGDGARKPLSSLSGMNSYNDSKNKSARKDESKKKKNTGLKNRKLDGRRRDTGKMSGSALGVNDLSGKIAGIKGGIGAFVSNSMESLPNIAKKSLVGVLCTVLGIGSFGAANIWMKKRNQRLMLLNSEQLDDDCLTVAELASGSGKKPVEGQEDAAKRLEHAKQVYSLFKKLGMPDYNIAGLLGNWDTECGINPRTVEAAYLWPEMDLDHLYSDLDDYTYQIDYFYNKVWPATSIISTDAGYCNFTGSKGQKACAVGTGIGQMTGVGFKKFVDWMRSQNVDPTKNWDNMQYQLAFICSFDNETYGVRTKKYMERTFSSTAEAATDFLYHWEFVEFNGDPSKVNLSKRCELAQYWYEQLGSWEVDDAFADSVISLSKTNMNLADGRQNRDSQTRCRKMCSKDVGISDMDFASLVASYAYPTKEHDGSACLEKPTEMFAKLYNGAMSDDPWITKDGGIHYRGEGDRKAFASCDRGVLTGIRTLGMDMDMPYGNCDAIYEYLTASDSRWKRIASGVNSIEKLESELGCTGSETYKDKLPAGAVFCTTTSQTGFDHIFTYTSAEVMKKVHGEEVYEGIPADKEIDCVHAQLGGGGIDSCFPYGSYLPGWLMPSLGTVYDVFVCVNPQGDTTYQNLVGNTYKQETACVDDSARGSGNAEGMPDLMNPKFYGPESGNPLFAAYNPAGWCHFWQCTTFAWSRINEIWGPGTAKFSGNGSMCVSEQVERTAGSEDEWIKISDPVPGSLFSTGAEPGNPYGHVGVVVSYDKENGILITDEAHTHGMWSEVQILDTAMPHQIQYMRRTRTYASMAALGAEYCAPRSKT